MNPLNPPDLLKELLDAGFTFSLTANGDASFALPAGDTPEVDELSGQLAWRWGDLEDAVREHLTATTPKEAA